LTVPLQYPYLLKVNLNPSNKRIKLFIDRFKFEISKRENLKIEKVTKIIEKLHDGHIYSNRLSTIDYSIKSLNYEEEYDEIMEENKKLEQCSKSKSNI